VDEGRCGGGVWGTGKIRGGNRILGERGRSKKEGQGHKGRENDGNIDETLRKGGEKEAGGDRLSQKKKNSPYDILETSAGKHEGAQAEEKGDHRKGIPNWKSAFV